MSYNVYVAVVISVTRAIRIATSEIITIETVSWTTKMISFIVLHKIGLFEYYHILIRKIKNLVNSLPLNL